MPCDSLGALVKLLWNYQHLRYVNTWTPHDRVIKILSKWFVLWYCLPYNYSQPRWLSALKRSRVHSLMIARRSLCPEKLGSNPGQGSKGINFSSWHGLIVTVTKRRLTPTNHIITAYTCMMLWCLKCCKHDAFRGIYVNVVKTCIAIIYFQCDNPISYSGHPRGSENMFVKISGVYVGQV